MSQLAGNQQEVSIAINPTNPSNLFAFSNAELSSGGLFAAFSMDGGATWTWVDTTDGTIADGDPGDPLPAANGDPTSTWDEFGNLFIAYVDLANSECVVATSIDGGQSFSVVEPLGDLVDLPRITSGGGNVWVTYKDFGLIVVQGAQVTGLGVVGTFSAAQAVQGSGLCEFGDIAIGPVGQVLLTCQDRLNDQGPSDIFVVLDSDGLGAGGFGAELVVTGTNVGGRDAIPSQPDRWVSASPGLAYDRSPGPNNGRVYLVYTDELVQESDDTDIFVRFSDDDGASWSNPTRVNDDVTTRSQFLPRIALDQTTGFIAVSWHDSRNDDGLGGAGDRKAGANNDAQLYASGSANGLDFVPNMQISTGTSTEDASEPPGACCFDLDYGDYTGLAYEAGSFYPAWADNSDSTGDNPDGATHMDIYTAVPEPGQLTMLGIGVLGLLGLSRFRRPSVGRAGAPQPLAWEGSSVS